MNNSNAREFPFVIIDGVFFQLSQKTGIARVWNALLSEWSNTKFAKHILVLDRGGTIPRIPGISYRTVDYHTSISHVYHDPIVLNTYDGIGIEAEKLQSICDEESADIFISTYYSSPITTPSIFMGYDMIPEVLGMDLSAPVWREKHLSIFHACHYITISNSTANDLVRLFPSVDSSRITVAHCGIEPSFQPSDLNNIEEFRKSFNILKPYVLFVGNRGERGSYKNAILLLKALQITQSQKDIALIFVGGQADLEDELKTLAGELDIHVLQLSDSELITAYSGASALVYPSRYEGFGLPLLEAMACGCPIITCRNSSIPEVAGNAVLYVDPDNPGELAVALRKIQDPIIREDLRQKGFIQAKDFSWTTMAAKISKTIIQVANSLEPNVIAERGVIWSELRKLQSQFYREVQVADDIMEKSKSDLKELQAELQDAKLKIYNLQKELQQANNSIINLKSSTFWKIKSLSTKIKSLMKSLF